jgi:hypothetical protein
MVRGVSWLSKKVRRSVLHNGVGLLRDIADIAEEFAVDRLGLGEGDRESESKQPRERSDDTHHSETSKEDTGVVEDTGRPAEETGSNNERY